MLGCHMFDDKQNDPNKYGQQNRQGDGSAKSSQNRKIQTRAASRVAANKEVRNASGNELLASTSSLVCKVLPAPNPPS